MQGIDSEALGHFVVQVRNRRQLNQVIRAIRSIRGVKVVSRISDNLPDHLSD